MLLPDADDRSPAPAVTRALEAGVHGFILDVVRRAGSARKAPVILVGGAVRDLLLNRPLADLDFAVQGNAVGLARAVASTLGGDFYVMDEARGTARVILKHADAPLTLDFAVCRGETWEDDLLARDFTLNAIALDPASGAILDPTGGQTDLAQRIIRQTRAAAIEDDPVRALRAVRLSLALSARIEPATAAAVHHAASQLSRPSPERVRDELMKLLELPSAAQGARALDTFGLLAAIAPEVEAMRACQPDPPHAFNVLEHTFVVMAYADRLLAGETTDDLCFSPTRAQRARLADHFARPVTGERSRAAVFRLALLLHDSGKPATRATDAEGHVFFPDHAAAGAELAARRARALKLSNDETRRIALIVRHHARPNAMARAGETSLRALYRLWRDVGDCMPELALLCVADGMGKAGADTPTENRRRRGRMAERMLDAWHTRFAPDVAPPPLIHGEDVLALGIAPGPRIGQMIEAAREAQMAGEIATRDEALAMLRALAAESGQA